MFVSREQDLRVYSGSSVKLYLTHLYLLEQFSVTPSQHLFFHSRIYLSPHFCDFPTLTLISHGVRQLRRGEKGASLSSCHFSYEQP